MNNFERCEGGKLKFMRVTCKNFFCAIKRIKNTKWENEKEGTERDNVPDDQSILFHNFPD